MDFRDSPQEAALRAEIRGWLEAQLPPFKQRAEKAATSEERLHIAADWQHQLYQGGFGALGYPEEFGGREASMLERYLLGEEASRLGVPWHLNMSVTLGWCAPALLAHGTDEQRKSHLVKMLSGKEIWCQMFSEPNAGSDLASLQTKAEKKGDSFVVNGQKIWSSGAHWAEWGILIAKTSDGPKYQNITFFIVDMKIPGIEIRPIRQITGESDFCEIFFTDCEIPASFVVGKEDDGWMVAISTLLNERVALSAGGGTSALTRQGLERIFGLAKRSKRDGSTAAKDAFFRQRLADVWIGSEANRLTALRVMTAQFKGKSPGPEASILKLSGDLWSQKLSELAAEILGPRLLMTKGASLSEDEGAWPYAILATRAMTIGGGTSEIQKNIIAERVLGLPKNK